MMGKGDLFELRNLKIKERGREGTGSTKVPKVSMALSKTRNTALCSKQRGKRKGIKRWAGAQLVSTVPGTVTG